MGLLHSGHSKLLELSCNEFSLTFTGESGNKKSTDLNINKYTPAELRITSTYINKIVVKTLSNHGQLVENSGCIMKPCFYEDGSYQLILELKDEGDYELFHMGVNLNDKFQKISKCYFGIVDFSSDIGLSNFLITKDGQTILSIDIEVFPSKIDYRKDYEEIMREINEEIYSLAFGLIGKTYLETNLVDTNYQTNAEFINILKCIFNGLERSIKRVIANPKHNVETVESLRCIEKSKSPSRNTISYLRRHPNALEKNDNGFIRGRDGNYSATMVVDKRKITTIDIYENRFVKYMITNIIRRLKVIENTVTKVTDGKSEYINFLREKRIILEKHIKYNFSNISDITGKKTMSLVFQMAPGYKEIYKKYIMLSKGLALGDGIYQMTPKKLYSLYEMWCYMKIHHILSDLGYEVQEYGILRYKDNGLYLNLQQDSEAKMIYSNSKNRLELWYNKSYTSPTTNQRPDTVLCIKNLNNEDDNRVYIFDAKYRINVDDMGIVGPLEEDINVMHRYRDAIVSKLSNKIQFKYDTFGAYVMFPYGDEEKFKDHNFYKSIEEVNIGAFPMLPGGTKLIKNHLEKIIEQSSLEARSDRVVIDEYDEDGKFKHENVMVVNVKDKNNFKQYKDNLFYHIPISQLSKLRPQVEYLAFYQSKDKFKEDGGVRYYGKIKSCKEYAREECAEIETRPATEKNVYLRIDLEEIKEVTKIKPIQFGTRLISYTTMYLLKKAENTHELKFGSSLELEVYKIMKKISKAKEVEIKKISSKAKNDEEEIIKEYSIGDINIKIDGAIIKVEDKEIDFDKFENELYNINKA
ncbi:DUF2357 domain-containing protein [Clostridium gasigenes]|uniref:DUF2357 domain-containing protein n=1 Tax=Clostridium gasigenes TaxID=94869 RepID=UPI001C0CC31C|nr:DUF2357 domain-containing protein [Clostridium gasigenes]MBU3109485.1 restriction endonuclease-like protein [Clostridium gasigenes]